MSDDAEFRKKIESLKKAMDLYSKMVTESLARSIVELREVARKIENLKGGGMVTMSVRRADGGSFIMRNARRVPAIKFLFKALSPAEKEEAYLIIKQIIGDSDGANK